MNRTTVTGKLTKDPEFKQHGSFNSVTFSLHHSRYAGKNQQTGQVNWETEFFDLEITGNPKNNGQPDEATAFMQRGFRKGDHLWVEATQKTNSYKDNQSGQDKKFKRLIVDSYEQVQPRPQQQQQQQQQAQPGYQQQAPAPGYAPAPQYAQPQAPAPQYAPAPPAPAPAPNYAPAPAYAPAPNYAPPQAAPAPAYAPPAPAFPPQPQYQPAPGSVPMPAPGQVAPPAPGPTGPPPQFGGGQAAPF